MTKEDYRNLIKAERNRRCKNEYGKQRYNNDIIIDRYFQLDCYKRAETIFAYNALGEELSVQRIIEGAVKAGKRVAVPRVITKVREGGLMGFVFLDSNTKFRKGFQNIIEPENGSIVDIFKICGKIEIIVPGLCFDVLGNRIGYGGGYYDRFFAAACPEKFHKTVLAFDYQLFDSVPVGEHDIKMDLIVTEHRQVGN